MAAARLLSRPRVPLFDAAPTRPCVPAFDAAPGAVGSVYSQAEPLLDRGLELRPGVWGSQLGDDPIQSTLLTQRKPVNCDSVQSVPSSDSLPLGQQTPEVVNRSGAQSTAPPPTLREESQHSDQQDEPQELVDLEADEHCVAHTRVSQCTAPEVLPPAAGLWHNIGGFDELSPCTQLSGRELAQAATALLGLATTGPRVPAQYCEGGRRSDPVSLLSVVAADLAEAEARRVCQWPRLRAFQRCAVEAWALGKHCFVVSGTGSGKSACFLLPALVARRWHERLGLSGPAPVALVISPLVALMRDQVRRLKNFGVEAAVHSPQCNDPSAWQRTLAGELAVCYLSPELVFRYATNGQLARLRNVSLLAIDEAHCVSEWGHDFRPEYGQLRTVIAAIAMARGTGLQRSPPVICLTATCTEEVRKDVIQSLQLHHTRTDFVMGTMNRPNLRFAAEEYQGRSQMDERLLELCGVSPGSASMPIAFSSRPAPGHCAPTVVYTRLKKDCMRLSELLQKAGVCAAAFHSELDNKTKQWVQDAFHKNQIQVVVATVAFGMGIDKPDVRRVVHYGMPSSIEAYAQESGRAGRDGSLSECLILYTPSDRNTRERAVLQGRGPQAVGLHREICRLQQAFRYCRNVASCRRAQLLRHLGEDPLAPCSLANSQAAPAGGAPGFCVRAARDAATRASAAHNVLSSGISCRRCDVCSPEPPLGCAAQTPRVSNVKDVSAELMVLLGCADKPQHGGRSELLALAQRAAPSGSRALSKDSWVRILDAAVEAELVELRCGSAQSGSCILAALSEAGRARLSAGLDGSSFFVDLGPSAASASADAADRFKPFATPPRAAGRGSGRSGALGRAAARGFVRASSACSPSEALGVAAESPPMQLVPAGAAEHSGGAPGRRRNRSSSGGTGGSVEQCRDGRSAGTRPARRARLSGRAAPCRKHTRTSGAQSKDDPMVHTTGNVEVALVACDDGPAVGTIGAAFKAQKEAVCEPRQDVMLIADESDGEGAYAREPQGSLERFLGLRPGEELDGGTADGALVAVEDSIADGVLVAVDDSVAVGALVAVEEPNPTTAGAARSDTLVTLKQELTQEINAIIDETVARAAIQGALEQVRAVLRASSVAMLPGPDSRAAIGSDAAHSEGPAPLQWAPSAPASSLASVLSPPERENDGRTGGGPRQPRARRVEDVADDTVVATPPVFRCAAKASAASSIGPGPAQFWTVGARGVKGKRLRR